MAINRKYLEQALRIRKDFESTDYDLMNLKNKLESINSSMRDSLNSLIEIKNKSREYESDDIYQKDVLDKLKEFEIQAKRISELYEPLNNSMESLRTEEDKLYETLISEYPLMKKEVIVKEIQDFVRTRIKSNQS